MILFVEAQHHNITARGEEKSEAVPRPSSAVIMGLSPTTAVRNSCRRWMEGDHTTVTIDEDALNTFACEIANSIMVSESTTTGKHDNKEEERSINVTEWDADGWHYSGTKYLGTESMRMERVAMYVLSLDAMNFCFWPVEESNDDGITMTKNGLEYEHLAMALRNIAEVDDEVGPFEVDDMFDATGTSFALSPVNLSTMTPTKLCSLLQPHFPSPTAPDSSHEVTVYNLPNVDVRCKLLNELGRGLLKHHDGSALRMISKANGSADALVTIILETFPGFRDFVDTANPECDWETATDDSPSAIHFYKRAQIAVADLWAALGRRQRHHNRNESNTTLSTAEICQFDDIRLLTTFPDYRVPQILRHVNVLKYNSSLEKKVDNQVTIEKGSIDETSIRAGTVLAVEKIVHRVKEEVLSNAKVDNCSKIVDDISAVTIDWYLWQRGEKLDRANLLRPHHRVVTTFY